MCVADLVHGCVSVDLLQMLEMNVTVAFPAAPLLTVILALVGATFFLTPHPHPCPFLRVLYVFLGIKAASFLLELLLLQGKLGSTGYRGVLAEFMIF